MRKIAIGLLVTAALALATAAPAYATSVKPPLPQISDSDTPVVPVPLPEVIPTYPVKPLPALPPIRIEAVRIASAVVYTNAMPCAVTQSAKFVCERRTTISVRSLEERCWTSSRLRLTVVSAVKGVVTVRLIGSSIRMSSRKCGNPKRAVASVSVLFPVKAVVDYSTGQQVDITRPITY